MAGRANLTARVTTRQSASQHKDHAESTRAPWLIGVAHSTVWFAGWHSEEVSAGGQLAGGAVSLDFPLVLRTGSRTNQIPFILANFSNLNLTLHDLQTAAQ